FEYFAAKKPILAFGPISSDVERLIEKTNTGKYFSYDEKELKINILDLFNNPNNFELENIKSFSRDKLTYDLANLLNNL
ncbi:MAG: glycosyl transferase family 1, partial [Flavobacteriales bacterium]